MGQRNIRTLISTLVAVAMVACLSPSLAAQTASPPASAVDAADRGVVLITATYHSGGRTARGSGSGIIIDPAGLILTAAHVVDRASDLKVQLRAGEVLPADVVGADRVYDVALLRIDADHPLPALAMGTSALLQREIPSWPWAGHLAGRPARPPAPSWK